LSSADLRGVSCVWVFTSMSIADVDDGGWVLTDGEITYLKMTLWCFLLSEVDVCSLTHSLTHSLIQFTFTVWKKGGRGGGVLSRLLLPVDD